MATKLPVAQKRMFQNVFVCKKCQNRQRTDAVRVINEKVSCRKCGSKSFRAVRKK